MVCNAIVLNIYTFQLMYLLYHSGDSRSLSNPTEWLLHVPHHLDIVSLEMDWDIFVPPHNKNVMVWRYWILPSSMLSYNKGAVLGLLVQYLSTAHAIFTCHYFFAFLCFPIHTSDHLIYIPVSSPTLQFLNSLNFVLHNISQSFIASILSLPLL